MPDPIDNDHLGPCGLCGYDGQELARENDRLRAWLRYKLHQWQGTDAHLADYAIDAMLKHDPPGTTATKPGA